MGFTIGMIAELYFSNNNQTVKYVASCLELKNAELSLEGFRAFRKENRKINMSQQPQIWKSNDSAGMKLRGLAMSRVDSSVFQFSRVMNFTTHLTILQTNLKYPCYEKWSTFINAAEINHNFTQYWLTMMLDFLIFFIFPYKLNYDCIKLFSRFLIIVANHRSKLA